MRLWLLLKQYLMGGILSWMFLSVRLVNKTFGRIMLDETTENKIALMLAKRKPDALVVLCQLVRAGLSKGYCSANDVITRDLRESNVIGGVFSCLRNLGFVQTNRRLPGKHASQHSRKVFIWELTSTEKAQRFVDLAAETIGCRERPQQLRFF